jgi:hypothetical protein
MPLYSFLWARVFFFLFGTMGTNSRFMVNVNQDEIYSLAIFSSAVVSVSMSQNTYAASIYVMIVWLLGLLNKWTKGQVDRDEYTHPHRIWFSRYFS